MSGGEEGDLGDRTGTGKPQPTEEELAARRKKRGEAIKDGPEGTDGFGGGPEGGETDSTAGEGNGSGGPGDE